MDSAQAPPHSPAPPIHPVMLATCPPFANARRTGLSLPSPYGLAALSSVQAPSSNVVAG